MKGNVERLEKQENGKVLQFRNKNMKNNVSKLPKLKKDGTPKLTPNNSFKGDPKEVYPIKNKEDVEKIKQYFANKRDNADNYDKFKINAKYLLLVILGFNTALRASDIVSRKWKDFLDEDFNIKDSTRIQEKKTKKYRDIYINNAVKKAIKDYITTVDFNIKLDKYVFESRQGGHIEVQSVCKNLKEAANSCGIKVNVGSHTLRKTWAYHQLMAHQNDALFLAHIQEMLLHDSPKTTLRYVGLAQEQQRQYYNDVEL